MIETKVYMYILKRDNSLYAFTINKDYAKKFEEVRNMKQFVKRKEKMDEYELMAFQGNHTYAMLQKDYLSDGKTDYEMIVTSYESTTLDECCTYINSIIDMVRTRFHRYPLKSKYLKLIDEITSKITVNQDGTVPTFEVLNIDTFRLFYNLFPFTFYKQEEEETNTF